MVIVVLYCVLYSQSLMSNQISFRHTTDECRKFFSGWSSSVSHGRGMWCIWSDDLVWDCPSLQRYIFIRPWPACFLLCPAALIGRLSGWRLAGECPGPLGSVSGGTGRASQTQTKKQARSVCHWRLLYKHTNTPTDGNTGHVESWETSRSWSTLCWCL